MFMFWAFNIVQISLLSYYRPQTKFAKVVFLHVSVILSTGGGLPQCMLGYHPPGAGTTPPPEQIPPRSRHPPEQCMLGDTANRREVRILLECILVLPFEASVVNCQTFTVKLISCTDAFLLRFIVI